MRGRKKEKTGFMLLELLAKIIILGILTAIAYISVRSILDRGNDSYYVSQEDMLVLAGREYYADHRSELPKDVGDTSNVTLETLIEQKYIDPIKDRNENDCDFVNSSVTVQKITETDYQYYGILTCSGDNYQTEEDEANPVIKFNPNKKSSQNSINVTMQVTDNVEVASVRYVITKDGEAYQDSGYQVYNGDINIRLTELGLYEITGYAIDTSGNMTSRRSGQYSIYKGVDCSNVKFTSSDTIANENITVKVNVPDNTYRWELSERVDGGSYQLMESYIGSEDQTIELSDEGTHQLRAVVYDQYGNTCTSTSSSYTIDKTPPTLSVVLKKKSSKTDLGETANISSLADYTNNTWYSGYVVLRGSCSDNRGSCTVSYQVTGASTNTDGYVNKTTRNINAEGTSTVTYRVTDTAGNVTTRSYTIKLDRTAPSCPTLTSSIAQKTWTNQNVSFTFDFDNDTDKWQWYTGSAGKSWTDWGEKPISTTSVSISGEGKRTIKVGLYDEAGNYRECFDGNQYYIDKTKPVLTYSVTQSSDSSKGVSGNSKDGNVSKNFTSLGNAIRKFSATDSASGISTYQYNSGSGWKTETKYSSYTVKSNNNASYRVRDKAGNYSNTVTLNITIQDPDPDKNFKVTCKQTCHGNCSLNGWNNDTIWRWDISGAGSGVSKAKLDYSTEWVDHYWTAEMTKTGKQVVSKSGGYAVFNLPTKFEFTRSYAKLKIVGDVWTVNGKKKTCTIQE